MKKLILLQFILISFSFTYAQNTFVPVGAAWRYYGTEHDGSALAQLCHIVSEKDTLVAGKNCRKILQTEKRKAGFFNQQQNKTVWSDDITTNILRTLYVYDNADTVFIFNEIFDRFTPLFVYNVAEGDTVCLPVVADIREQKELKVHPLTGDTSFCFVIDSVRTVLYDTAWLQTFYTRQLYDSTAPYNEFPTYNWSYLDDIRARGSYARKIGGLYGGMLPLKLLYSNSHFDGVLAWRDLNFRCYEDNAYNIKMEVDDCDSLPQTTLSLKETNRDAFKLSVSPNPSSGRFRISGQQIIPENTPVSITDLSGKLLWKQYSSRSSKEMDVNISHFRPGLYLLSLVIKGHHYYQKLSITS